MVEIRFRDGFPEEVQPTVQALLEKWAPYFCTQVNRIFVRMDNEDGEARIGVNQPYRIANLYLTGEWLNFDADMRERIIVHELAHILTDPSHEWAESMLGRIPDRAIASMAGEWFSEKLEGMTEDIARAIYKARTDNALPWPILEEAAEEEEEEA